MSSKEQQFSDSESVSSHSSNIPYDGQATIEIEKEKEKEKEKERVPVQVPADKSPQQLIQKLGKKDESDSE